MMLLFWITMGVMTSLALVFVLRPLFHLRSTHRISRDEFNLSVYQDNLQQLDRELAQNAIAAEHYTALKQQLKAGLVSEVSKSNNKNQRIIIKPSLFTAIALLIFIPMFSMGLYFHWGDSQQLEQYYVEKDHAKTIRAGLKKFKSPREIINKLKNVLAERPNSARGWFLLGRIYSNLGEYNQAQQAFAKANELKPKQPGIILQYAQASFFANGNHLLPSFLKDVKKVLQKQPNNPAAINLLALNAYSTGRYQQAVYYWEKLIPMFPPQTKEGKVIFNAIAKAQRKLA